MDNFEFQLSSLLEDLEGAAWVSHARQLDDNLIFDIAAAPAVGLNGVFGHSQGVDASAQRFQCLVDRLNAQLAADARPQRQREVGCAGGARKAANVVAVSKRFVNLRLDLGL